MCNVLGQMLSKHSTCQSCEILYSHLKRAGENAKIKSFIITEVVGAASGPTDAAMLNTQSVKTHQPCTVYPTDRLGNSVSQCSYGTPCPDPWMLRRLSILWMRTTTCAPCFIRPPTTATLNGSVCLVETVASRPRCSRRALNAPKVVIFQPKIKQQPLD